MLAQRGSAAFAATKHSSANVWSEFIVASCGVEALQKAHELLADNRQHFTKHTGHSQQVITGSTLLILGASKQKLRAKFLTLQRLDNKQYVTEEVRSKFDFDGFARRDRDQFRTMSKKITTSCLSLEWDGMG